MSIPSSPDNPTTGPKTGSATGSATGVIDIHAHFIPTAYRTALAEAGLQTLDGGMPIPEWSSARALEVMDRHGIGKSILSVSSPGLTFVDVDAEAGLAREINDAAARIVSEAKGRFGAFATLPVGDPDAALIEIERALDGLGLDGVILESNHGGAYPGDAAMAPILAELNRRKACVFLHPTSPTCLHCISGGRPAPLIEFPFETTRAVVDLIYSGTLERLTDMKVILAHAGGTLPFLTSRISGFARMGMTPDVTPDGVTAQLERLYYDTALSASPVQIAALRALVPASQILFGSDWPFSPEPMLGGSLAALNAMGLLPVDLDAILRGNAERLLAR